MYFLSFFEGRLITCLIIEHINHKKFYIHKNQRQDMSSNEFVTRSGLVRSSIPTWTKRNSKPKVEKVGARTSTVQQPPGPPAEPEREKARDKVSLTSEMTSLSDEEAGNQPPAVPDESAVDSNPIGLVSGINQTAVDTSREGLDSGDENPLEATKTMLVLLRALIV
ncbi:MAG TPA: hypothetical protein VGO47_11670 [Chlamydiales bacterium]|nr:hypothetical protein [Chlamydiales bacterium]